MPGPGRVYADVTRERVATSATIVTAVRTVASVAISATAAWQHSLTLLCIGLVVHWVGDSADGFVARVRDCETRTGAVLDILSDRLCASAFYIGLVWLHPHLGPAVFVYLLEFMVVDGFLSLGFLAWPLNSPNHFHVVDRKLWQLNWSHPGKAVNSGLFAILLVVTDNLWAGLVVAVALLSFKCWSLARLVRLGMPIPEVSAADRETADRLVPVKLVLSTLGVAFASALLPFVNIEAYLAAVGAAVQHVGVWWVAGAAAVGQTAGKIGLYFAADWTMNLPWLRKKMATPKWQANYARWRTRVEERPAQTGLLLFASASLGFPPLYIMAILAGQLKVKLWIFVSTCLVGRYIRFVVLLGGASWFVGLFR